MSGATRPLCGPSIAAPAERGCRAPSAAGAGRGRSPSTSARSRSTAMAVRPVRWSPWTLAATLPPPGRTSPKIRASCRARCAPPTAAGSRRSSCRGPITGLRRRASRSMRAARSWWSGPTTPICGCAARRDACTGRGRHRSTSSTPTPGVGVLRSAHVAGRLIRWTRKKGGAVAVASRSAGGKWRKRDDLVLDEEIRGRTIVVDDAAGLSVRCLVIRRIGVPELSARVDPLPSRYLTVRGRCVDVSGPAVSWWSRRSISRSASFAAAL